MLARQAAGRANASALRLGGARVAGTSVGAGAAAGARNTLRQAPPQLSQAHLHESAVRRSAQVDLAAALKTGLKEAMKAKDSFRSTVIRSLLSEQQYAEKEGNIGGLSGILQRAVARRQESARQFRAASPPREELAEKEDREASFIQTFLPEQISTGELEGIVQKALEEAQHAGVTGKKLMGDVMKRVNQQVDKARASGAMVSDVVRRMLPRE